MDQLFYEIFGSLPRQGPGSTKSTLKAAAKITQLPANAEILDLGCGTGFQTLVLARYFEGRVTALDNYQPFLEQLKLKIGEKQLDHKVRVLHGDLKRLDFDAESFDLIWSEGAIYVLGFKEGLINWKRYLKPNGYLVVSEIAWVNQNPGPDELVDFWQQEYPDMTNIERSLEIIHESGYHIVHYFKIPEQDWWELLYSPLEKKLSELHQREFDNAEVTDQLSAMEKEIRLRKTYPDQYAYYFFIMKKN